MINTSQILMNRLKSLKVLLSIDSPEVRGWSPLVQENAQHIINDAINYIKDTEEYVVKLTQQNTALTTALTKLASVIPEKCPVCDRTLIDGEICAIWTESMTKHPIFLETDNDHDNRKRQKNNP